MIDQDQQRDHAEEAAVAAEQLAERASEEAFEATQQRAAAALSKLAADSRLRAYAFARQLNDQIERMALPEASHLLMMKRAMTVAHMAQLGAASIAAYLSYDLRACLDAALRPCLADDPSGTGAFAATRVRLALGQAIEAQQEHAFANDSGHED